MELAILISGIVLVCLFVFGAIIYVFLLDTDLYISNKSMKQYRRQEKQGQLRPKHDKFLEPTEADAEDEPE